jgi:multiple sugar transport system ATP-binding protein
VQGATVSIQHVSKRYGDAPALFDVSLDVEAGEFLTLLGPSGCGKSTLLRLIAGFETIDQGKIFIGGRDVGALRPKERGLSMVFQSYALYPHMSVFDNIATPLVMRQMGFWQRFPLAGRLLPGSGDKRRKIAAKVGSVARLLEIEQFLDRKPAQLSGGQRQRVALGRAIVPEPSVFLMDEPLSNLDARLRLQMRNELTDLHRKLGITFIYVTHDQIEAMTMSHRIAVLMDGKVVQSGRPSEVYACPRDIRVARFIGAHPINILAADVAASGHILVEGQRIRVHTGLPPSTKLSLGVRPEDITLGLVNERKPDTLSLQATIERIEDQGADLLVHCRLSEAHSGRIVARIDAKQRSDMALRAASQCNLAVAANSIHVFDAAGRRVDAVPAINLVGEAAKS